MAKSKETKGKRAEQAEGLFTPSLKEETKHGVIATVCIILAFFFLLASWHRAGAAGDATYHALYQLFGSSFFVIPLSLIILGVSFIRTVKPNFMSIRLIAGLAFFVAMLGLIGLLAPAPDASFINAGLVGRVIAQPLNSFFGFYSLIFLVGIMLVSLFIIFDTTLTLPKQLSPAYWWRSRQRDQQNGETGAFIVPPISPTQTEPQPMQQTSDNRPPTPKPAEPAVTDWESNNGDWSKLFTFGKGRGGADNFAPPPLNLLEADSGKPAAGDIKSNANIIKRTLANFGIVVDMDEISIGPSITRYALKPAEGVKLSKILALQNDLSLALAAHPLRIEAPIPGRSLVGIEIPNKSKSTVGLASLIGHPNFSASEAPLLTALGRDIAGQPHYANVGKAPHMLIAGTTGSGKSVVIHTFITSLLYRHPPERLRFIMIDPKRVELTVYNKIPHLLTPVVTEAKKAIMVLKWAAKEMERRYEILQDNSVRDITSYHKNILPAAKESDELDKMPYIVIVIDELADIMSSYPRELEAAIVRLAQMSRAVGIHLILSTQRPSVEVITGLIKANIPSRIALQVSSQIDSRTIIDMAGAEKLLGAGDLLYLSGDMGKPIRLQSAFISEEEVKKVVAYIVEHSTDWANNGEENQINLDNLGPTNNLSLGSDEDETNSDDDSLYEEARAVVLEAGKASASYLQRKLKVGYARAARLLDLLEEKGVIGPGQGAKQREVYQSSYAASTTNDIEPDQI
jgi:S-DNA-T family DNA segregation ATPase FtsK/SpoIIIE